MKRQIIVLGLLIVAVCVISLIPFRGTEGFEKDEEEGFKEEEDPETEGFEEHLDGNASVSGTTVSNQAQTLPTTPIESNADFMTTVNNALSSPANESKDKTAIYNVQTRISGLTSQNAKTLLSEISNPTNLSKPRTFLQYMNWFGSKCPITSDTCTGLQ